MACVSAPKDFEGLAGQVVGAAGSDPLTARDGGGPERRVAPQCAQRSLDSLRRCIEGQRDPGAESLDAAGVERLIAPERQDQQRDSVGERP